MARRNYTLADQVALDYETVAAGQSDQVLGATGAAGDLLARLVIVPAAGAAPGAVSIKDGGGSAITVFAANAGTAVTPVQLNLNIKSLAGAWKVTTGSNVSVVAIGSFT